MIPYFLSGSKVYQIIGITSLYLYDSIAFCKFQVGIFHNIDRQKSCKWEKDGSMRQILLTDGNGYDMLIMLGLPEGQPAFFFKEDGFLASARNDIQVSS